MLPIILGFSVTFVITLSFVYPITAIDLFTYVAQSRILLHYHQNPIFVPPSSHPRDAIMYLSGGWMHEGSPYGPVGILVDALPELLFGSSLLVALLVSKLFFGLLVVALSVVVFLALGTTAPRLAISGMLLIAWNPLILFESVANGHNDVAMMLLVALGLLATLRERTVLGAILVFLSALVKYASLPLFPLMAVFALSRPGSFGSRVKRAVEMLLSCAFISCLAYAGFWRGWSTFKRPLLEDQFHLQSFSGALSFWVPAISTGRATLVGQSLFAVLYLYAIYLASKEPEDLIRGMFLTSVGSVALAASNVKTWYAVWPSSIGALERPVVRFGVVVLGFSTSISVVLFDFVYGWLGTRSPMNFPFINAWAYALAFGTPILALAVYFGTTVRRRAYPGLDDKRSSDPGGTSSAVTVVD